jgi:hypothetical protein
MATGLSLSSVNNGKKHCPFRDFYNDIIVNWETGVNQ